MLKSDKAERFEQALHVAHTALCAVATGYLEAVAEALATLRAREITGCASTAEKMPLASPAGERTTHLPVTPEVTADPRQLAIPGA